MTITATTTPTVSVYLAGFEVFAPDGPEIAERMRATCRRYGLEPISPLDKGADADQGPALHGEALADLIYANNIAMIERADAILANLNHFRGPDPDAGTCFEVGYAVARGKASYVYASDGATAVERTRDFFGPVTPDGAGGFTDADGFTVENFGAPFNLMLSSSSTVVLGDFEACVARLAADAAAGVVASAVAA
ncbi:nucleoside 2-deoxyribosyltransferase [Rathayibacter sp. VKM Ac-2760]|nr:nucleoside 2-deoxyribosyltransferase [Rathayibacter sp. VKM Ac-2760]